MKKRLFHKNKKAVLPQVDFNDKGAFPDFTKKEIFLQPKLIEYLINKYVRCGRINFDRFKIKTDKIKRIYITGSGADYGCVLAGAYNFEVLADIQCQPSLISEFNFSNPVLDKNTLVVIVGGSAEEPLCAQTLERAQKCGAKTIGVFNNASEDKNFLSLDFVQKSPVSTAGFSLKYIALCILALYFGEKNKVITELYVRVAVKALCALPEKIKYILENEYFIKHRAQSADPSGLILTGRNVDFAAAAYGAYLLSFAFDHNIRAIPTGELFSLCRRGDNIIAFASGENFYKCMSGEFVGGLKIIPKSINAECADFIDYDGSIPLFNPVLSAVVCQIFAYYIAEENGASLDGDQSENK